MPWTLPRAAQHQRLLVTSLEVAVPWQRRVTAAGQHQPTLSRCQDGWHQHPGSSNTGHALQLGSQTSTMFIVAALCLSLLPCVAKSDSVLQFLTPDLLRPCPILCLQATTVLQCVPSLPQKQEKSSLCQPALLFPLPLVTISSSPFPEQVAGAVPWHPGILVSVLSVGGKEMLFCWERKRFPTGEGDKRAAAPSPCLYIVLQSKIFLSRRGQALIRTSWQRMNETARQRSQQEHFAFPTDYKVQWPF